jgi:hypothetical protein
MQAKDSSEAMLKMLSAKVDLLAASLNETRELLHTGKHSAPSQQVCNELLLLVCRCCRPGLGRCF